MACDVELERVAAEPDHTFDVDCAVEARSITIRSADLPQRWSWDRLGQTDNPGWNGRLFVRVNDGAHGHFGLRCLPDAVAFMAEDARTWHVDAERSWRYDVDPIGQETRHGRIEPGDRHSTTGGTDRIFWRNGPFVGWIAGDDNLDGHELWQFADPVDALLP